MTRNNKHSKTLFTAAKAALVAAATITVTAAGPAAAVVPAAAPLGVAGAAAVGTGLTATKALSEETRDEAARAAAEAEYIAAVAASMQEQARIADATWHNPVASYYISSYFDEIRPSGPHNAVDLAGAEGQDVFAGRTGTVTSAGWQSGYGFTVEIDHGDGHTTLYAHLMSEPYVTVGQRVAGGQPIGALGSTGFSTGPHLHLEVKQNGVLVDPLAIMPIPQSAG
jgi:murein DD-endopeptidase MepM/ murein hydrolase activator NlpD